MCVIMLVTNDKIRPTRVMVEKAFEYNGDGVGFAYREGNTRENREVVWKKGFEEKDLEEVFKLSQELPVPYVVHFRAASIGDICKQLTHPFPVDVNTGLAIQGKTKGYVLFHNGHWSSWNDKLLEVSIKSANRLPRGKWSDSRAMAWLSSVIGDGFMEFLPEQKGVLFGPNDYDVFTGKDGWKKVNDVWCSNDYFMTRSRVSSFPTDGWGNRVCRFGQCQSHNVDNRGYCPLHKDGILRKDGVTAIDHSGTGGSSGVTPFPQVAEGTIISMELVEKLHKKTNDKGKRLLSKNMYKEMKKQHERMEGKDPKQAEKAKKVLIHMTKQAVKSEPSLASLLVSQHTNGLVH